MKELYGVFGASGFGREVMPLARCCMVNENSRIVFVDDSPQQASLNGFDVVSFEQFLNFNAENKRACISISDSKIRQKIYSKLEENDINHWSVYSKNSIIMDSVVIGENSILTPFVTLTSNIRIGKSFHANLYSYVAHDCVIGDFVTFAPGVKCNGNVHIGDNSYIGTGAIIKQGRPDKPLRIGKGATVAAGAFVNKDVPEGITVFGSPAIELNRENMRRFR